MTFSIFRVAANIHLSKKNNGQSFYLVFPIEILTGNKLS